MDADALVAVSTWQMTDERGAMKTDRISLTRADGFQGWQRLGKTFAPLCETASEYFKHDLKLT